MPKRIIDPEAVWSSTTLARVREEYIPEYLWLYGLADANGNFEIDNLRVIHGKVAAIRPNFSIGQLSDVLTEFKRVGLLYTWRENGREYGHWTKSNLSGRQPPLSQRNHYPMLKVKAFRDLKDHAAMDAFYLEVERYIHKCSENSQNGKARQTTLLEPEPEPDTPAPTTSVTMSRAEFNERLEEKLRETEEKTDAALIASPEGESVLQQFHDFMRIYPRSENERSAWREFIKLNAVARTALLENLPDWLKYWADHSLDPPWADRFLLEGNWTKKPKGGLNGNARQIGRVGGNAQGRVDRIKQAAVDYRNKRIGSRSGNH